MSAIALREREYRPDIDGLRAVAILCVVLEHAGVPCLSGGFTGVDIFFVISGFLIGGHIYNDLLRGEFSYLTFYQRRAKRILPPLYVVLIVLLLIGLVLLDPVELRQLSMYMFAAVGSASNVLCWLKINYFAPWARFNLLLMTWSLGVEEQFYLVIPLLIVLLSRIRKSSVLPLISLIAFLSFCLAWKQLNTNPNTVFYLLPARAWELSVGVLLAIWETNAKSPVLHQKRLIPSFVGLAGVILILFPIVYYNDVTPFPGPFALPSVIGSGLLIAASGGWVNRRLLSLPPLVFIGRISYSWYLWHWPVLALLWTVLGRSPTVLLTSSAVVISFGLAILSYYFVERPFRASKRPAAPLLWRYAAVSFALMAIALAVFKLHGINGRYPVFATVNQSLTIYTEDPCVVLDEPTPNLAPACTAEGAQGKKFVIWGDSHALALAQSLRVRVAEQGYSLAEYTKTGCQPLIGVALSGPISPMGYVACIRFNDEVLAHLVSDPRVETVALTAYWTQPFMQLSFVTRGGAATSPCWSEKGIQMQDEGLLRTIQLLREAHKQVVVFGDVPVFAVDPLWRMRTERIPLRLRLYDAIGDGLPVDPGLDQPAKMTAGTSGGQQSLQEIATSTLGVTYWDLKKQLCPTDAGCFYRQGDIAFYVNNDHLAREGGLKALQGWIPPRPDGQQGN